MYTVTLLPTPSRQTTPFPTESVNVNLTEKRQFETIPPKVGGPAQRVKDMGIEEVPIAPRSPWQNPYCERIIGSIRRDCLDHVIVLNEAHLHHILTEYFQYYHNWRPHLSLDRNSPTPRCIEPPSEGKVVAIPQVGGLHHRYTRRAA